MFTLAHLSDPHLGPLPQPRLGELLGKRLTGYLNWQRNRHLIHDPKVLAAIVADMQAQRPDHIAVTGDIANIALPAEFPRGRDFLENLGPWADVSFVPGNHDIYVREAADLVQRSFGAQMRDDDGNAGFPYLRRRGDVALVGICSGAPTLPFMATGWLGTNQLLALQETLFRLERENAFRVVMIHHPPVSRKAAHKRLLDAPVFLRVIADVGAELIIHGHDHVHALQWLKGPDGKVPSVGVPSASASPAHADVPAAYNLYRIDGEAGAWRCEMISRGIVEGEIRELGRRQIGEVGRES